MFFVLYNIAMSYTTAARASLALATLPLHTMVVGARARHRAADEAEDRSVSCIAVLGVVRGAGVGTVGGAAGQPGAAS